MDHGSPLLLVSVFKFVMYAEKHVTKLKRPIEKKQFCLLFEVVTSTNRNLSAKIDVKLLYYMSLFVSKYWSKYVVKGEHQVIPLT